MTYSRNDAHLISEKLVVIKATSSSRRRSSARVEFTAAGTAIVLAIVASVANDVNTNRAVILGCGMLWIMLGALATRELVLLGSNLTKTVILVGVTFWFWIEAMQLAFDDPPFLLTFTYYPYLGNEYPPDLVAAGIFSVSLFGFCLVTGYNLIRAPIFLQRVFQHRDDIISGVWLDVVCMGISVLGWVPLLVIVRGDLGWLLNMVSEMRAYEITGHENDAGLLAHFGLLSVAAGALALARFSFGYQGSRLLQTLAFSSAVIWVFLTGSRFNLAYLALPSLFELTASLQQSPGKLASIIRWKIIALAIALAVALILQGALRNYGIVEGRSTLDEESVVSIGRQGGFGYEHFSAALLAIDFTRKRNEYFMEPMTPFFFTQFIPRTLWPEKPYSESWLAYNDVVTGASETFNVTPSVIGQYYMNWGFLGVAYIGLFFGAVARLLDGYFAVMRFETQFFALVVCGMWVVFLFLSFRFFYPLYITFPVAASVMYFLLSAKRITPAV